MKSNVISIGRRGFLGAMGLLVLARCSGDDESAGGHGTGGAGGADAGGDTSDAGPSFDSLFDAWRALRESLEASPDNLPAQAKAAIASKDAERIFRFVRDNVATLPSPGWIATGVRWGVRGTLRGGAGTPRERADLLAFMFQQAGFVAEVVAGTPADALAAPGALGLVYGRTIEREFAPGAPPAPYGSWVEAMGDPGFEPVMLDEGGKQSAALAAQIEPLLPPDAKAKPVVISATEAVPLVKVRIAGKDVFANPLLPSAELGQALVKNPLAANTADPVWKVEAKLSVARSDQPSERIPVASASFDLDVLIGRQLALGFEPPEPLESLLGRKLEQLNVFTPVIAPSGIDLPAEDAAKLAALGSTVTLGGDVIEVSAQGAVTLNGLPIDTSVTDPNQAAKVKTLAVEVNASTFPAIELAVSALDAGGKPVPGLAAGAFALEEGGASAQLVMRENGGDLRVLFLIDQTGSQPQVCTDPTQAAQLGTSLGQALLAAFPQAKIQAAAIGGVAPTLGGYTATTPQAVGDAFKAAFGTSSAVHQALAVAAKAGPSVIVVFTDGDLQDDPSKLDAWRAVAATGAPVLAVGTAATASDIKLAALDAVAKLTGGTSINAGTLADLSGVNTAIQAIVQKRAAAPYRFTYRAPASGPSTRSLKLTVGSSAASGTYLVPAQPQAPRMLSGIYLELTVGKGPTVKRTLAGWDADATPPAVLPPAVFEDVRAALLGGALLSLEGGAPGASVWYSDLLSTLLSHEGVYQAARGKDPQKLIEAMKIRSAASVPWEVALVQSGLTPAAGAALHEQSVRAVLYRYAPSATAHRRIDILPTTRFATFGLASDAAAFAATMKSTLGLAVVEQTLFPSSTASLLAGKPLKLIPSGPVAASSLSFVPPAEQEGFARLLNAWPSHLRVVAADGSSHAFWAIDVETGSVLGVLPDGTGGGFGGGCKAASSVGDYFELLNLLAIIMGYTIGLPGSLLLLIGKMTAVAAIKAAMCFTDGPFPPNFGDPSSIPCGLAGFGIAKLVGAYTPSLGSKAKDWVKGQATKKAVGAELGGLGCPPMIPGC